MIVTVSPPPGVSSRVSEPPIAVTNPWAIDKAEPDAVADRNVAESLERLDDPAAIVGGDADAPVDDAEVHVVSDRCGLDPHRLIEWAEPFGVGDDVGEASFEQRAVADDRRRGRTGCRHDALGGQVRAVERGRDDVGDLGRLHVDRQSADLQPAGVEQVADEQVEAVGLLVDGDAAPRRAAPGSRRQSDRAGRRPSP